MKGRILLESSRLLNEVDIDSALQHALTLTETATRTGACRRILDWYHRNGSGDTAEQQAWIRTIPDAAVRAALLAPPPQELPKNDPSPNPVEDPFDPFAAPHQ